MVDNHNIFDLQNIITVAGFQEEYSEIVGKLPNKDKVNKEVVRLLHLLSTNSVHILSSTDSKHFEKLSGKNARNLYAMRIQKKDCNLRILFTYNKPDGILLLAFEEKSGKRITDYSLKIPEAQERLKVFKGGKKP